MINPYKKKIASLFSFFYFKKKIGNKVLTYHSVSKKKNNTTSDIYQIDPDLFIKHIQYLIESNNDLNHLNNFKKNKNNCLITFDDGFKNFKNVVLKFLFENKVPCEIFLSPNLIKSNNKEYLNINDLKEIAKNNLVKIGSHAYHHKKLIEQSDKELDFELESSKKWLEDMISKKIDSISYPFGAYNYRVLRKVKKFGYQYGYTTKFNFYSFNSDKLQIPRIDIWSHDNINIFRDKINGKWNWMRYFSKY